MGEREREKEGVKEVMLTHGDRESEKEADTEAQRDRERYKN